MAKGEKVYTDGYIRVPERKWYQIADALTRQDELMEAILKVLGKINEKLERIPRVPPTAVAPAPLKLAPLTERFDRYFSGLPVAKVNRYSGTDTSYRKLVEWVVGAEWGQYFGYSRGELREISVACSDSAMYAHTLLRITVKHRGREHRIVDGERISAPLTIPFARNRLEANDSVTVEVRSDGTSITVDGLIAGREFGE